MHLDRLSHAADAPNTVWAVDFQFDTTTDGRPFKIASVVDEHTRESLCGLVERGIDADALVAGLDTIVAQRGTAPAVLRCDNGPEPISAALADGARQRTGVAFIDPGSPLAERLGRVVQRAAARGTPQPQPLRHPARSPDRDPGLEGRVQPRQAAQLTGLPGPNGIRCYLHPPPALLEAGPIHGERPAPFAVPAIRGCCSSNLQQRGHPSLWLGDVDGAHLKVLRSAH